MPDSCFVRCTLLQVCLVVFKGLETNMTMPTVATGYSSYSTQGTGDAGSWRCARAHQGIQDYEGRHCRPTSCHS